MANLYYPTNRHVTDEKSTWNVMANGTIFRGWRLAKTPSLNGKKLEIIVEDNAWIPCLSDPKLK